MFSRSFCLCPGLSGKKPIKVNLSGGKPDSVMATMTEEGPGKESRGIPWLVHSLISLYPGSEISGVPASDISATFLPAFSSLMIFGICRGSLKSFKGRSGFFIL